MIEVTEITRITIQKNNQHRYNIFIKKEGKEQYGFSVEEETLISEGLKKGKKLDQVKINELMRTDDLNKAYNSAIHYLSYRMRSTKEIKDYLLKKELDEEQIGVIIERLNRHKLLDDQAFAEAYVTTKMNTGFKGPEQIRIELVQKGIKHEMIDYALQFYSEQKQLILIEKWLGKQMKKSARQSYRQRINKMKQQLMQKGFQQSTIEQAFQQYELDKDDDQEWQALVYQGEKALRSYQAKSEGYQLVQKIKASLYRKGFNQDLIERFIDEHLTN